MCCRPSGAKPKPMDGTRGGAVVATGLRGRLAHMRIPQDLRHSTCEAWAAREDGLGTTSALGCDP